MIQYDIQQYLFEPHIPPSLYLFVPSKTTSLSRVDHSEGSMNFGFGFGGLASAGFPPPNTPSSACACCGQLCDHKYGQCPMDAMSAKLCSVCESYTYILCSNKCLKKDRKRHAKDCRERLQHAKAAEERSEKEKRLSTTHDFRRFATEMKGSSDPKMKDLNGIFNSESVDEQVRSDREELDKLREENCTEALQLRNKQLHHATQMYKQRHNLDEVGLPPHVPECRYCKKAAKVNPQTFQSNLSRCSKCLLVRCEFSCAFPIHNALYCNTDLIYRHFFCFQTVRENVRRKIERATKANAEMANSSDAFHFMLYYPTHIL